MADAAGSAGAGPAPPPAASARHPLVAKLKGDAQKLIKEELGNVREFNASHLAGLLTEFEAAVAEEIGKKADLTDEERSAEALRLATDAQAALEEVYSDEDVEETLEAKEEDLNRFFESDKHGCKSVLDIFGADVDHAVAVAALAYEFSWSLPKGSDADVITAFTPTLEKLVKKARPYRVVGAVYNDVAPTVLVEFGRVLFVGSCGTRAAKQDWFADGRVGLAKVPAPSPPSAALLPGPMRVHSGFLGAFSSQAAAVLKLVRAWMTAKPEPLAAGAAAAGVAAAGGAAAGGAAAGGASAAAAAAGAPESPEARRVVFCGHSLGAAVAQLLALAHAKAERESGGDKGFRSSLVTIGCPRGGDEDYQSFVGSHTAHIRLRTPKDPIPGIPSGNSPLLRLLTLNVSAAYADHVADAHWEVSDKSGIRQCKPSEPTIRSLLAIPYTFWRYHRGYEYAGALLKLHQ